MNVLAKFSEHKVAKNVSVMVLAQLAARAVGVIYIAALARYVGSEGVGMISTATVLNGLMIMLVAPGLDTLFVRDVAADKRKAGYYLSNALFIRGMLGIPFVLLVEAVARAANYPGETVTIVRIYVLVYLLDALCDALVPIFRAHERMEYEAATDLLKDITNVSLSLLAIFLGWPLVAIAAISAVARVVRLMAVVALVGSRFVRIRFLVSLPATRAIFLASLPFGALTAIHTIQAGLGTFVLSLFRPASDVGIYAAGSFIITTLLLLASSFSKAIFPTLSSLHARSATELRHFYKLAYKHLLVLGFPLGLGTMLVGDKAVTLVYGEGFVDSTHIVRILAIFLFTLVGYSNGPLLNATGHQRFFMWTQAVAATSYALLLLLLVPAYGPIGTAIAFVLPGIGTFFVHSFASHRVVDLPMPWGTMARIMVATLFMGGAVAVALSIGVPWLLAALLVGPATYLPALVWLRILDKRELRDLARGSSHKERESEGVAA